MAVRRYPKCRQLTTRYTARKKKTYGRIVKEPRSSDRTSGWSSLLRIEPRTACRARLTPADGAIGGIKPASTLAALSGLSTWHVMWHIHAPGTTGRLCSWLQLRGYWASLIHAR